MGCDIHMFVEYKPKDTWLNGDYFLIDNPEAETSKRRHIELYGDRDYPLFAILAGVRSYELEEPIDYPRGLPEDVTEFVKNEYRRWGMDAHSCSYFTLRELIEFDEENEPRNNAGEYILKPLIDRLKQRADELRLIYDFSWSMRQNSERTFHRAEDIRIVFWFDN